MLELIRIDRPEQFINKVVKIEDHELKRFGILYNVTVDMEIKLFDTTIKHYTTSIPYPIQAYLDLYKSFNNENPVNDI